MSATPRTKRKRTTRRKWQSTAFEEYHVIAEQTTEALEARHRELAREGWRAQGGVCVTQLPGFSPRYHQAMVRGGS